MKQSPEQTKEISINASYYLMHINYAIKSKSQKNTGDVFPTSLTPATHWSDRKPYMQITEANPTWNPYHRQVIRLPSSKLSVGKLINIHWGTYGAKQASSL